MLKIEIKTGNAAFCNPETGEEDMYYEGFELSRILRQIADRIDSGMTSGSCIDLNGNKVGKWSR